MQMKQNNRGFSLIELIVAMAILGVVATGAFSFMTAGADSYRSVYTNVSLQYAMQQAMGQIQETILDCNTAVCGSDISGSELYLLNRDDTTGIYTVRAYTLSGGELIFQQTEDVNQDTDTAVITGSDPHILVQNVSSFTIQIHKSGTQAAYVTVSLELTRQGKTYGSTQEIALRNRVPQTSTLENLLQACE